MIEPVSNNTSYANPLLSEEKVAELESKIERLNVLILQSKNPEIQYQALAILNFQLRRFSPALKAVQEAEAHSKELLPIHLCILERAKYYASIYLYSKAQEDLDKIIGLKGLTSNKQWEITNMYGQVMENLNVNVKDIHEKNAELGIPKITFSSNCGETDKTYRKRLQTYKRIESEMQELEDDKEVAAEKLKERFRGDKEAFVDHLVEKEGTDGPSMFNAACILAKKGSGALHEGDEEGGVRILIKAKDLFDKVIKLNENSTKNPDLWYFRALINAELENFEAALDDINHAIKLAPEQKYIKFKECIEKEI